MSRVSAGMGGLWLVLSSASAQEVELADGETVRFDVPQVFGTNTASTGGFSFFVPQGVRNARVALDGSDDARDIDLFLRADEPFSDPSDGDRVFAEADFWSISAFDVEYVNLQDFATPAVHGRRWYAAVVAFAGAASNAELSLDFDRGAPPNNAFEVDFDNAVAEPGCDTAPWNSSQPYTPEGGNQATTVGQARRNAMLEAAERLSEELSSRVPIRILACWRSFGEDSNALASAGPYTSALASLPGLPPETFYVPAAYTRLAGTDRCRIRGGDACEVPEVIINFNTDNAESYYYGFEPATASTVGRDFISVALHEITHGIGFIDFLGADGSPPATDGGVDFFGAFDRRLALLDDAGRPVSLADPAVTDAERAASFTSFTNLLWLDDQANVQVANSLATFEAGLVRMNAPPTFSRGSSVSHVSGAYCDLMRPNLALCADAATRELGLSRRIMDGVGWADSRDELPAVGLYLDRTRPGHGYDLRLGGIDAGGQPIYVLTFYTYRALGGTPEWYQAIGTIRDGAFVGTRNGDGNGLPRYRFDPADAPPQTADPDTFGQVAVSLNNVARSPACTDGEDRRDAEARTSFQWSIDRQVGEWCAEPLVGADALPAPENDFGGLWFAGVDDQGWGFTIETIEQDDGLELFVLAYVYDADGSPVWFFATAEEFVLGLPVTMTLFQRTGYPRTLTNGTLDDAEAGELTLTLVTPSNDLGAGNRATINVNFTGTAGGSWVRDDVPIQRLTAPR